MVAHSQGTWVASNRAIEYAEETSFYHRAANSYLEMFAQVKDDEADMPRLSRQHLAETLALLRGEVDAIVGYSAWGVSLPDQVAVGVTAQDFKAREVTFAETRSMGSEFDKCLIG